MKKIMSTFMAVFLFGCSGGSPSISIFPTEDVLQQSTNADIKIDILFVVDDSGSMSQEQQDLNDNFREFISLFYNKGFDFRVAVSKTSAYGNMVACKEIATGNTKNCTPAEYASGLYISRETGLTPKEFRCGLGNNCGFNSQHQTSKSIPGTVDSEDNGETLTTTEGNGTPSDTTDHILSSTNLTRNQMIDKFKKNILVGLAGSGDERPLEAAETVLRNMKQFLSPANQFPRPNAHLAVIHVGDEGDGGYPNLAGTGLMGSNRNSGWGSIRSTHINNSASFFNQIVNPATGTPYVYENITLVANDNYVIADHLAAKDSYLQALKNHETTSTVSVHAIQDLPSVARVTDFPYIPTTAVDSSGSTGLNQSGTNVGYSQAYLAEESGGLIFSKAANFGASLSDLGDLISTLASRFYLTSPLDSFAQSNLQVFVQGINGNNALPRNAVNGYQYDALTNSITFHGSMIPPQGAKIGLIYTCSTFTCE